MFSTKLISTPRKPADNNGGRIDFTPIGRSKRQATQKPQVQHEPHGRHHNDFDNTMDTTFDRTVDESFLDVTVNSLGPSNRQNLPQPAGLTNKLTNMNVNSRFNNHNNNNILNNTGITSIKEQELGNRKLETENFNLKIKLATLTKFFNQTPEEQKELLNQNIDLKSRLMQQATMINGLENSLKELKYSSNKENDDDFVNEDEREKEREVYLQQHTQQLKELESSLEHKFELEKKQATEKFNEMIDKYEHEIDSLKSEIAAHDQGITRDHHESIQQYKNQISDLQAHLEQTKDDLGDLQRDYSKTREALASREAENMELNDLYETLKAKYEQTNTQSKNDSEGLYDEMKSLQKQLHILEDKDRHSQKNVSRLNEEIDHRKQEIKKLELEIRHWETKFQQMSQADDSRKSNVNRELLEELESSRHEIRNLNSKIRDLEFENNSVKRKMIDAESVEAEDVSRLNSRIMNLMKELKDKDKEEYNLRSQLDALVKKQQQEEKDTAGSSATLQYYKSQSENLQARETQLKDDLRGTQRELEKLQDQLKSKLGINDRIVELQEENKEINDKLDFYEKEYAALEKSLQALDEEARLLGKDKVTAKERLELLEKENQKLLGQLRSQFESNSGEAGHRALDELESFTRRKLENEKQQLREEVDSLNFELNRMKRELMMEKSMRDQKFDQQPYKSYHQHPETPRMYQYPGAFPAAPVTPTTPTSNYQYSSLIDDKESRIRELQNKSRKLETQITEKDTLIETLESKIREMDRANKLNILVEDEEKTDLLKQKSSQSSKIKILQREIENLQKEYQAEVDFYKNKIQAQTSNIPGDSSSTVALLEKQLKDSQAKRNDLSTQLNELITKNDDTTLQIERLKSENLRLLESIATLETNESMFQSENNQLETKIRRVKQELERANKNCTKLADKLREIRSGDLIRDKHVESKRVQELQYKNSQLQMKQDELVSKLLKLTSSPTSNPSQLSIKENELKFYKAKLYDSNLKVNDLKVLNGILTNSIKNSNQFLKDDIIKLTKSGVYPDYNSMNGRKKLTFKVLATFVLASVRIKNRLEKAERRNLQLFELKSEIEKGKLVYLD